MNFDQVLLFGGAWAIPAAAAGGIVAGLNPCCLALYPAVGAICCARAEGQKDRIVFSRALLVVLGAALATTVLGVLAALAGHAVTSSSHEWRYALALVPIFVGLHIGGVLRMPFNAQLPWRSTGSLAALGAGIFFSVVASACGTPLLAAILSYAAYEGSVSFGALLLFSYGMGNGLPVLAFGTVLGAAAARTNPRAQHLVNGVAAATLIALGFYLLVNA